jgi:hypothetical protein|tara:strand:+ start:280 stop:507 length:228 start_codon:yes stop_codon:yes gene_type:complete
MKFYIFNGTLKKFYAGFGKNGMPEWTSDIIKAEEFSCMLKAEDLAWHWLTCGRLVVVNDLMKQQNSIHKQLNRAI